MFHTIPNVQSENGMGHLTGDRTPMTQTEQEQRRGSDSWQYELRWSNHKSKIVRFIITTQVSKLIIKLNGKF